ncbi:MAG: hypothetical protein EOO01_30305 [Chitinophagaceae bacterium]|nr:MAG: hypothetical protein EOO01_30305 [Chitinophagaceae bacterium]
MRKILALMGIALMISCGDPAKKEQANKYFDLKTYFEEESARLQRVNPQVEKTVLVNANTEVKRLRIPNWKKEFEIFIAADINKVNWAGLIHVSMTDTLVQYTARSEKVFVKKLAVHRLHGVVKRIDIIVNRDNMLYNSADTLTYVPDRFYSIKKQQNIRLLPSRSYAVSGKFM